MALSRRRFISMWNACAVGHAASVPRPMWRGSRWTEQDRERALERGLQFIYNVACSSSDFVEWGHDLLWCFYTIASTARSSRVRDTAAGMGRERAATWRRLHPAVPTENADVLAEFVFGTDSADRLGLRDDSIRERVRTEVARFTAIDFLGFDPRREPPPSDIPETCPKCQRENARGAVRCATCGRPLSYESRYEIWLDALITTYTGDIYGIPLGGSYDDVLKWISVMRPYATPARAGRQEAENITYAITHVVYTLNDYGKYRLSRSWLPQEFEYLRNYAMSAEEQHDPETLGEFMDTLRAFGMTDDDRLIRSGIDYLLHGQNSDGSWGNPKQDAYARYHTTWTAVDGLREYAFRGERLRRPGLMPLIRS